MRAKKSLGQNFLTSTKIAHDIAHAGNLTPQSTVLEIGPGKGFLTRELLKTGARVIAVEKDDRLIPVLEQTFASEHASGQLTLIHGDIIELLKNKSLLLPAHYSIIANIPYYITGLILRTFLENPHKPDAMILLVQKEVADRIIARDGKEGLLSLSVKAYATPTLVTRVPARYFNPKPKVDSAVIAIRDISAENFSSPRDEAHFFALIHAAFAHKRKQLGGNMKSFWGDATKDTLERVGISASSRSEDVPLHAWLALMRDTK